MAKSILCPYCFKKFKTSEALYQCTNPETDANGNNKCALEKDKEFSDHWHKADLETHHIFKKNGLFSGPPKEAKCPKCGHPTTKFLCPHCHNWLPTEMVKNGAEIISIIGAPGSGKTVYITALISELNKYGHRLNLSITAKDESRFGHEDEKTTVITRRMRDTLFREKYLPEKTSELGQSEQPIPLIYELVQSEPRKEIYLVFYDTAGETFNSQDEIKRNARYLKESSAVILLIDPYSITKLEEGIGKAGYNADSSSGNAEQALESLLNSIGSDVASKDEFRNKPIAIAFSKIDAVINAQNAEDAHNIPGLDFRQNSSFLRNGKLDLTELKNISDGIKEVCREEWELGSIPQKFEGYNARFFGVSSLGENGNEFGNGKVEAKPYRVLDPLVWALSNIDGFKIPTIGSLK